MFSKGTTWPPRTPAQARALSGFMAPSITDGMENVRSPSESTAAPHGDSRPTDSHWDSVIDRATD